MRKQFIILIALIIILAFAGFFIGIPYADNIKTSEEISVISKSNQTLDVNSIIKSNDFSNLPRVVKNYLSANIKNKTFSPKLSKITIVGKTRDSKNSDWIETNSILYFSTAQPNFIEVREEKINSLIWNKTKNVYVDGIASTITKFLSSITTNEFEGNKLNKSYLVLYLMEAVFSPTTLLPNKHVKWKYFNNTTANATVWNKNLVGNATFHFNDNNQITKIVSDERYMPGKIDYSRETFTIHFANYKDDGRYIIPTYFELEWNLAGYDFTFARYQITDISYQ
jgi:hypothetical protein